MPRSIQLGSMHHILWHLRKRLPQEKDGKDANELAENVTNVRIQQIRFGQQNKGWNVRYGRWKHVRRQNKHEAVPNPSFLGCRENIRRKNGRKDLKNDDDQADRNAVPQIKQHLRFREYTDVILKMKGGRQQTPAVHLAFGLDRNQEHPEKRKHHQYA